MRRGVEGGRAGGREGARAWRWPRDSSMTWKETGSEWPAGISQSECQKAGQLCLLAEVKTEPEQVAHPRASGWDPESKQTREKKWQQQQDKLKRTKERKKKTNSPWWEMGCVHGTAEVEVQFQLRPKKRTFVLAKNVSMLAMLGSYWKVSYLQRLQWINSASSVSLMENGNYKRMTLQHCSLSY